jgi:hypothetical protein
VIRFSAVLVAVAIGVLIVGGVTSRLALVYTAIVVSAAALVILAIGVLLKREEIFGNRPGLAPAEVGAGPAVPAGAPGRDLSGGAAPATLVSAGVLSGSAASGSAPAPAGRTPDRQEAVPAAVPAVPHRVLSPSASTDRFAGSPAAEQQPSAGIPAAAPWERPTRAEPRPMAADGQPLPASLSPSAGASDELADDGGQPDLGERSPSSPPSATSDQPDASGTADADAPAADAPAADAPVEASAGGDAAAEDTPEADTAAEGNDPALETASAAKDAPASVDGLVAVIRGVLRYHQPDCVLIRFMPDDDLEKLTVPAAQAAGCTACTACTACQPTE